MNNIIVKVKVIFSTREIVIYAVEVEYANSNAYFRCEATQYKDGGIYTTIDDIRVLEHERDAIHRKLRRRGEKQ